MKKGIILISLFLVATAYGETYFGPADMIGTWLNNDINTQGLTKLIASERDNSIVIRAYGKCEPNDCDWGEYVIQSHVSAPIPVVFENDFKTTNLMINSLSKSSIHVRAITTFKNMNDSNYNADYYMYLANREAGRH